MSRIIVQTKIIVLGGHFVESRLMYSIVPNKRPVSNKRLERKFLLKIGTMVGQMIKEEGSWVEGFLYRIQY